MGKERAGTYGPITCMKCRFCCRGLSGRVAMFCDHPAMHRRKRVWTPAYGWETNDELDINAADTFKFNHDGNCPRFKPLTVWQRLFS